LQAQRDTTRDGLYLQIFHQKWEKGQRAWKLAGLDQSNTFTGPGWDRDRDTSTPLYNATVKAVAIPRSSSALLDDQIQLLL